MIRLFLLSILTFYFISVSGQSEPNKRFQIGINTNQGVSFGIDSHPDFNGFTAVLYSYSYEFSLTYNQNEKWFYQLGAGYCQIGERSKKLFLTDPPDPTFWRKKYVYHYLTFPLSMNYVLKNWVFQLGIRSNVFLSEKFSAYFYDLDITTEYYPTSFVPSNFVSFATAGISRRFTVGSSNLIVGPTFECSINKISPDNLYQSERLYNLQMNIRFVL